jgi:hypothetical protein
VSRKITRRVRDPTIIIIDGGFDNRPLQIDRFHGYVNVKI